ncbi:unnamed protein product [Triticum turgidum subsp. durum]|uniref:F-box protein AT5G49610-like beta-propeller domain-containing protein n=1 Tax=Triticum turgidum subsp. durum TaxID=4567 RepID=A0A9R0SKD6_TRITD|nr:unnamed protein product [Triticum turgidum subsp. durum]
MLGFLHTWPDGCGPEEKDPIPHYKPTTKFGARFPDEDDLGYYKYDARDCRHGRVLLGVENTKPMALFVWDLITGCLSELSAPDLGVDNYYGAAVLCAVSGCDHRICHADPFQVVFVGLDRKAVGDDDDCVARACVSLPFPPFDEWDKPCPALHLPGSAFIQPMPSVLIQDALHFMLEYADDADSVEILKYDLSSHSLSLIDAPIENSNIANASILMAMEDSSLGFAHVNESTLYLWSRLMDSNGVASWSQRIIINLRNLLPIENPEESLRLVGSVEGRDVVFVATDLGIYEINVKSQRWKKIWKRENFHALIPYMSFYNQQERVMPSDVAH